MRSDAGREGFVGFRSAHRSCHARFRSCGGARRSRPTIWQSRHVCKQKPPIHGSGKPSAYGWLGREAEAKAELAEALKLAPGATVNGMMSYVRNNVSDNRVFIQQIARQAEGLRKAGLLEE
ncbi:MAG TPA: hypothetical protein VKS78_09555 [Roseiarcus sp.]|nr:hypothetical protein [Roseiarcus sp.]